MSENGNWLSITEMFDGCCYIKLYSQTISAPSPKISSESGPVGVPMPHFVI